MILVELCERRFERQFTPGDLEPLHQIGRAREQDAPTILDQREADGSGQMGLAATRRAEQDEVGTLLEPSIAGTHRHDLRLGDHWHSIEREGIEGLSGRELGFGQMPLGPPPIPFGDLMLGERGQKPGRRPAFLVCARGKIAPDMLDCRQAQLVQHEAEPLGVDRRACAHAASPHPIRLS